DAPMFGYGKAFFDVIPDVAHGGLPLSTKQLANGPLNGNGPMGLNGTFQHWERIKPMHCALLTETA
ncbi:MAG TPA: hypothetical protein VEU06_09580, partial [Micropepsaceae bacterium]|nr:hypothetical protein [Micropepsaceae bacterium]